MGMVLGGRYRLEERIAAGGLGDVWRCLDQGTERTVAAKVLSEHLLSRPGFVDRLRLGWARELATIDHRGVVRVHDTGVDPAVGAYVIMEYVEGGDSLHRILAREGRLTPARAMDLVAQTADALRALHGCGIVHRDLRPGKVLVRPDSTVVLSAFGLGYQAGHSDVATWSVGMTRHLSPEQLMGNAATQRSDIFCLGVIAYMCLAGRRPFDGTRPMQVAVQVIRDTPPPLPDEVPVDVRSIVERAMAKDPAHRWADAGALAAAARAAAGG